MNSSLFISSGKQQGTVIPLSGPVFSLGRASGNHFQILDREVSRRHCEIVQQDDGYWIRDLASNNGTLLNGAQTSYCRLNSGDRIRVGQTEFLFTGVARRSDSMATINVQIADDYKLGLEDSIGDLLAVADAAEMTDSDRSESSNSDASPIHVAAKAKADLEFVYQAFFTIGQTLDEQELFARVLEQIFEWVKADRACIVLFDSQNDDFVVTCAKMREASQDSKMRVSRSIITYVREHNEGVLTHDARDDLRWANCDSAISFGVREAICVPLKGSLGFIGAIYADMMVVPASSKHKKNAFNDEHLKIMMAIGNHAAMAVENARYYAALVKHERLAAVGQTIASLSHHIKNILQGINGGTYLLEDGLKTNDKSDTQRGWAIVKKHQDRISHLVMDMLSYSKEREPVRDLADLEEVVNGVVELLRPRAESAGVQLRWQPNGNVPPFEFDAHGINHAVINLVQNAIDACEQVASASVEISVGVDTASQRVFVAVSDNGQGIDPAERSRLFELFHSTKGNRGTGLGLAVSQKIVHEHGGEISVDSTPGAGSRFVIWLQANASSKEPKTYVRRRADANTVSRDAAQ